jgi:hypothetical protein
VLQVLRHSCSHSAERCFVFLLFLRVGLVDQVGSVFHKLVIQLPEGLAFYRTKIIGRFALFGF